MDVGPDCSAPDTEEDAAVSFDESLSESCGTNDGGICVDDD